MVNNAIKPGLAQFASRLTCSTGFHWKKEEIFRLITSTQSFKQLMFQHAHYRFLDHWPTELRVNVNRKASKKNEHADSHEENSHFTRRLLN